MPVPDMPLDPGRADQAEQVFNKLRLPDVVGLPSMSDWSRGLARIAFGAFDGPGDDARRTIDELFLLAPKKNAKTGLDPCKHGPSASRAFR